MRVALPKIASLVAGFAALIVTIAVVFWFFFPAYRGVMYRPGPEHRTAAVEILQGVIGEDAQQATVPAVNLDIGLIYVTAPLSSTAVENVRKQGRIVENMPGEVYEFATHERTLMIDLKTSPSKIMIGASRDSWNGERCVLRYREWLEGKKLPWP